MTDSPTQEIRYCVASAEVRYVSPRGWRPGPAPRRSRPTIHRPHGVLHAFDLQIDAPLCGTEESLHVFTNASWGNGLGQGSLCAECIATFVDL